ncbi:MAG: hypothetical protein A2091_06185 [Desulfuromonadales bacterium GWD2_61_12]|nr:MAG: hypothetical protein A2005_10265 [Desulfuromonadales bacterium GWC2_61_20]OGR36302.1 MAG: hypothetical protein A2091_06185 [Desulfuromonadales bacterium GWD2_61_12]HAD04607.1 outer membrane lipoprotein carrier protein LolA [Desulfuromonas sp.]HBT82971.1 outer membrane lipoprotein carrier protein LolA [Desulfuromonas sp.]
MKSWLLSILLLFPSAVLAASPVGINDVIQTLETPFRTDAPVAVAIVDFQADFFQESHIAALDKKQRGEGTVAVKFVPGIAGRVPQVMFRWEYRLPNEQEIVSDGQTMWVYLPENRQVIESDISAVSRARSNDPLTFLSGLGNLSRDFTITWAMPNQDRVGNYVLDLQPRRASSLIRQLLVVVDRDAVATHQRNQSNPRIFPILSTTTIDPSDNRTIIEFSNVRTNVNLAEMVFRFNMPPGVDVVRPSGAEMGY